jgi:hypothetical protein
LNTLALCVVAKSADELKYWLAGHDLSYVHELVAVDNAGGRFGGYGHVAERALASTRSFIFGLCHADTVFKDRALEIFREVAAVGNVTGMVGRTLDGAYHWSQGGGIHSPSCLDGCAIFFRRDSGLRFDTRTFDGFHCVGEDLALSARARGIPLVIPHAVAEHTSSSNFPPGGDHSRGHPPWLRDYYMYVDRLKAKYPQLQFLVS